MKEFAVCNSWSAVSEYLSNNVFKKENSFLRIFLSSVKAIPVTSLWFAKGPVVVYFYPSAYTGGCDLEAHTFAEMKDQFTKAGATIIGVSADDIQRLNSFSSDPSYCAGKFPVASDADGKIAAMYGLQLTPPQAGVKDVRGVEVTHGFIPRTTFVIGKDDKIVAVFSSKADRISPDEHVKKSLEIVKSL